MASSENIDQRNRRCATCQSAVVEVAADCEGGQARVLPRMIGRHRLLNFSIGVRDSAVSRIYAYAYVHFDGTATAGL